MPGPTPGPTPDLPPLPGQRRLVTVVFCDLVGSTALAERLDPEVLRDVTLRYFDLMRDCVQAHGGVVEKFIGDAVMAAFGIPVLHEDDSRRALAAAHAMRAGLDGLNAEIEPALGVRLRVRIGVNTGEVVTASDISAGHGFVSGEAVNVAARLEQHADPGQILVGPRTVLAAGGSAVVEPVGQLELRGTSEPITAYALLEVRDDDPELVRRFDLPFVGRGPELAELSQALERVARQHGSQLLTLYGEAGIGKTRLVRAWLEQLGDGVRAGVGRCRSYGETGTLAALAEAVTGLAGETGGPGDGPDLPAVLRTGLLHDGTPTPSVGDTVAAVSDFLAGLTQPDGRPVVVVIDDCHWAGPVLLDVVEEITDRCALDPVLVVCLARPDLLERRPGWGGGRLNASSLVLHPLPGPDAHRLAAGLVEVSAHAAATLEDAVLRAEGNPLHLEQLVTALLHDGFGPGTDPGSGPGRPLPPSVHELLAARVDALAPPERLVLDLAAVIGRDFAADGVRDLGGGAVADPTPLLRGLSRRRLVEPLRGLTPGFRFCSGLIHEVAYQAMAKRVRAERHERLAGLLAARDPSGPGPLTVLAGHLEAAHRFRRELGLPPAELDPLRRRAAAALARAGAAALARVDLDWAIGLLGRAVALYERADAGWAPAARDLGEALLARGRIDEAATLLGEVVADAGTDDVTAAHVRLLLSAHGPGAGLGSPARAARAALPVFEAAGDALGLARAAVRLAQEQQFRGRHGEAMALLGRGVDQAAVAGAEAERASALGAMGVSLWLGPAPAGEAIERALDLLREHGAGRRAVQATLACPLAVLLAMQDRPGPAREYLAEGARLTRELGYAEAEAFVPLFGAQLELLAGVDARAETMLREALAAAHALGDVALASTAGRDLARLLLDRLDFPSVPGDLAPVDVVVAVAEAADLLSRADPRLPPAEAADAAGLRARIAARSGRPGEAGVEAARAVRAAGRTDSPVGRGFAHLDRALALRPAGPAPAAETAEAARAATLAARWFTRKGHLPGARRCQELSTELSAELSAELTVRTEKERR